MLLGDALGVMDRADGRGVAIPFSITWATFDKNRRTGGEVRRMDNVVRCGVSHSLQRHRQVAVKPADGEGHPIPIHLRLILRINDVPVT